MNRIFFILLLVGIFSCKGRFTSYTGHLPIDPVNIEELNTEFDDYNSANPITGRFVPLCYSTNRNYKGVGVEQDFDIIFDPLTVQFDTDTDILTISQDLGGWSSSIARFSNLRNGLEVIKSNANELGPYMEYSGYSRFNDFEFLIMYANDENGDFDIKYTYNLAGSEFLETRTIDFLNSEFDDLYPSFSSDYNDIYFCSNRSGDKFNIYSIPIDNVENELIKGLANVNSGTETKVSRLSSDYDDKCPYIYDNTMVFTSNRPGGYGGYDLYYSKFENEEWSTAINLGEKINTEFDEYRPIIFEEDVDYQKYMMLFSSDRPGGKGGFDLYYVGVSKDVEIL